VLFNTGVGYFQREGTIDGDARMELTVPVADVNDLLKTLTIDDGGKPAGVSIDSSEPLEETLANFSLDLAGNPTFGELLNQARGEKVEVSVEGGQGVASTTLTGTIVGMEAHFEGAPPKEVHHLNLLTADGARHLPLARVTRVRFLDGRMDEDFRRALAALAGGRGNQRRLVTAHLRGDGKRTVKIAHVAEAPIWKASYRLDLDAKGAKAALVTNAVVENTTESDWKDVRLVLVSGRPVLFRMDLAKSLFVPRPTLEPRYYASLRPPEHVAMPRGTGQVGGGAQIGGQVGAQLGGGLQLGLQLGGALGAVGEEGRLPGTGSFYPPTFNRYQSTPLPRDSGARRLSYEELLRRRNERLKAKEQERTAAMDHGSLIARQEGVESIAADADRIGEAFRYTLDRKVTVPRQKSALLPVLESRVEATRVSVYNRGVHPFFPMSSLRVKNTTGQHLQQGPLAVREEGMYAGDARLPDLQPGQEKLVSYAMDLGLEVRPATKPVVITSRILSIEKGWVMTRETNRAATVYKMTNRSKTDRLVVVEHPRRQGWSLHDTDKPAEQNEQLYRFEWTVPAGKSLERTVTEELVTRPRLGLERSSAGLLEMAKQPNTPEGVAKALRDLAGRRQKEEKLDKEIDALDAKLKPLLEEQERLRTNLRALPKDSAATKRVVARFDKVEEQVVKLKDLSSQKQEQRRMLIEELAADVEKLNVK
jgi:hypothetical protein